MSLLQQQRFPRLWTLFQYWLGGTIDKRRLCLLCRTDQRRILEVGCATGNITPAFRAIPGADYTGIDLDPVAIAFARRTFAGRPGVRFLCQDLGAFAETGERFDYVLFAGILHHVDDETARTLLLAGRRLLAPHGILVAVEPLTPEPGDPWFVRQFIRVERGQYVRTHRAMQALLGCVPGMVTRRATVRLIGATPFSWPICARFGVYELTPRDGGG